MNDEKNRKPFQYDLHWQNANQFFSRYNNEIAQQISSEINSHIQYIHEIIINGESYLGAFQT